MTVADLLGEEHLGLKVLSPPSQAPLRWVATSELDDPTPHLHGGELLLTTGLHDASEPRDWATWLDQLADAGVVAVGFGTGLSHDRVPSALVHAGSRRAVGVLEIPRETPFIAVTRAVADLLRHSENATDAAAARVERKLTREATRPAAADRLLQRLADGVAGSAWLVDDAAGVLRATTPGGLPEAAVAMMGRMGRGPVASGSDITRERTLVVRPLEVRSGGRLYLVLSAGPHFSRAWHGAVSAATALLGVVVERERAELDMAARWAGCALDLLLAGQVSSAHEVLRAGGSGAELPAHVRAMHPRLTSVVGLPVLPSAVIVAVSPQRGDVVLLCPGDDGVLEVVEDALRRAGTGVGVGPLVALADVGASDRSAAWALRGVSDERLVVRGEDSGSLRLASAWGAGSLEVWAEEVLAPLAALDAADGEVLRLAVHAFIAHHGSRQDAADALGVHRNTLRQRLDRAQVVLGRSLGSPQDRAELWFALEAARSAPPRQQR